MIFTNLEKYVYSKKCLKQRPQPPPLPPAKSKVFSRRKSHLAMAVMGGPTCTHFKQGLWLAGKTVGMMT